MSGWAFLSKAEGFLDRVLEEQSKPASASGVKEPPRSTGTWQERLSKAASQFAPVENKSQVLQSESKEIRTITSANDLDTDENLISVSVQHEAAPTAVRPATIGLELTELQKSAIFPANMPDKLEDQQTGRPVTDNAAIATECGSFLASTADEKQTAHANYDKRMITGSGDHLLPSSQARVSSSTQLSLSTPPSSSSVPLVNSASSTAVTTNEAVYGQLIELNHSLQNDLMNCEARRMEEAHSNAERISALESRLAYFSGEQINATTAVSRSNEATSLEKQLAEKDQRIALLLEEGDSLSKKELLHMANLKKLRSRVSELESLIAASLKAVEKAEEASISLKHENKSVGESLKRSETKIKELQRLEIEVSDLRRDKQAHMKTIADLKRQLSDADETISQNVTIWTQLQSEKGRTASLQNQIGSLLLEAKSTAEENALDLEELQSKFDRHVERYAAMQTEKQVEIEKLESEIEQLRASLEETTTVAAESSQTKLLRQVETLQTQSSLARQNWARIEESLVLRSNHAEKERDELRIQEDDLRVRLRQVVLQKKSADDEKLSALSKIRNYEATIKDMSEQLTEAETKKREIEADFEQQRNSWLAEKDSFLTNMDSQIQEKLAEERSTASVPQSPFASDVAGRVAFAFQRHVPESPQSERNRPAMASRRSTQSSRLPYRRATPASLAFLEDLHSKSPPSLTPREEDPNGSSLYFTPPKAPTEISLSTISGGNNVGMIERLSNNSRKLELEMQIMKEDLHRMTRQRDEAMEECVAAESVRVELKEVRQSLEAAITQKEQTRNKFVATLELLGEQTEENEQLKEDIVDMRKMLAEISSSKVK